MIQEYGDCIYVSFRSRDAAQRCFEGAPRDQLRFYEANDRAYVVVRKGSSLFRWVQNKPLVWVAVRPEA